MTKRESEDLARLAQNPRASLISWERYAPVVRRAFESYPEPCVLDPLTIQPNTFESRIRDAIRGAIAFDYPRDFAYGTKLAEWWKMVVVRQTIVPPRVIIARKENKQLPPIEVKEKTQGLEFTELTLEEWRAFILLVNNGRLQGPITVRSKPNTTTIQLPPNVQLLPRPDGSIIIL